MASDNRPARGNPSARKLTFLTIGIVAILAVLAAGIIGSKTGSAGTPNAQTNQSSQQPQGGSSEQTLDLSRRVAGDPTALGDVDAPVVLIEYSDYRCPFCGVFARETMPQLVEKYVDTGDLRIEWRDFPVFGDQSIQVAVAGRAAAEQGKFWAFNEAVFAVAPERGHADLPPERLVELAEKSGVEDIAKFKADMKSDQLEQAVTADANEAASLGATGTPTFLINGQALIGAQPLPAFEQAIEAALRSAEAQ